MLLKTANVVDETSWHGELLDSGGETIQILYLSKSTNTTLYKYYFK